LKPNLVIVSLTHDFNDFFTQPKQRVDVFASDEFDQGKVCEHEQVEEKELELVEIR
jgi:hypothetical protein